MNNLGLSEVVLELVHDVANVRWSIYDSEVRVRLDVKGDFVLPVSPGVHNDVRAERKGRSVQQMHKRFKFENIPTVVPLLFIACTWACTNTCTETSQRVRKWKPVPGHHLQWSKGRMWWQTLKSAVWLQSRSSHFTAKWGDLWGDSTDGKKLSLWLFWSWWLLRNISFGPDLCHLASSVVGQWSNARPC